MHVQAATIHHYLRLGYIADISVLTMQGLGIVVSAAVKFFCSRVDLTAEHEPGSFGESLGMLVDNFAINSGGTILLALHAALCHTCARTLDSPHDSAPKAAVTGTEQEALLPQEASSARDEQRLAK